MCSLCAKARGPKWEWTVEREDKREGGRIVCENTDVADLNVCSHCVIRVVDAKSFIFLSGKEKETGFFHKFFKN